MFRATLTSKDDYLTQRRNHRRRRNRAIIYRVTLQTPLPPILVTLNLRFRPSNKFDFPDALMFLLHFVKIIIVHCWRTNEFGQSFLPSSSSKFVQTHNTKIEEDGKSLKRFKNLKSFFLKIGMQINPSLRVSFPIRENQFATALAFLLRPWAVSSKSALHETRNTGYCPSKNPSKREKEKKRHIEKLGSI